MLVNYATHLFKRAVNRMVPPPDRNPVMRRG